MDVSGVVCSACVGEGRGAFEGVLEALGRDDGVEVVEAETEAVAEVEVGDLGVDEVEEEGVEVGLAELGRGGRGQIRDLVRSVARLVIVVVVGVCVLVHAASLAGRRGDARGNGGMSRKQRTDAVDATDLDAVSLCNQDQRS